MVRQVLFLMLIALLPACERTLQSPSGNHPPVIVAFFPAQDSLRLKLGQQVLFSVQATDEDGDSLIYRWLYNGLRTAVIDSFYLFHGQAEGRHEITAVVSDPGGLRDMHIWFLDVRRNQPPFVAYLEPKAATIGPNDSVTFVGRAVDPDHFPDSLQTYFTLGGSVIARGDTAIVHGRHLSPGAYSLFYHATDGADSVVVEAGLTRLAGQQVVSPRWQ